MSAREIQRHLELLLRLNASRRVYANQATAAGVELSQPAFSLLRRLHADGPMPMGELARRTRMDPGATARQVNHLEAGGLVRREQSREDGRIMLVRATAAGNRAYQRVADVLYGHMHQVLSRWPAEDRREFAHLLGRFVDDLVATSYASTEEAS